MLGTCHSVSALALQGMVNNLMQGEGRGGGGGGGVGGLMFNSHHSKRLSKKKTKKKAIAKMDENGRKKWTAQRRCNEVSSYTFKFD